MPEIPIHGEYITLGQLLKVAGEVQSGGQIKDYLANESPNVNGQPEQRRGRKLRVGDIIAFKHKGTITLVAKL